MNNILFKEEVNEKLAWSIYADVIIIFFLYSEVNKKILIEQGILKKMVGQ